MSAVVVAVVDQEVTVRVDTADVMPVRARRVVHQKDSHQPSEVASVVVVVQLHHLKR